MIDDKRAKDKQAVLDAIAAMTDAERPTAERLHALITDSAPELLPRTWYGMPAYSNGNKVILFFRDRKKFGERYMTLGFNDSAQLDDGLLWPIVYALTDLTPETEAAISALVKRAVGGGAKA